MSLTRAQRRVVYDLDAGGQIWAVSSADEPADDPGLAFVVGIFHRGEFAGTQPVQIRTLLALRHLGLADHELL